MGGLVPTSSPCAQELRTKQDFFTPSLPLA